MKDLGTLGGTQSLAFDINSLLPADSGLKQLGNLTVNDINNNGQIVGYGDNNTLYQPSAFLLTPTWVTN